MLNTHKGTSTFDARWSIGEVVRRSGKSALRQAIELISVRRGPGLMDVPGYYGMGLWRREFTREQRFTYVSAAASARLNNALSPKNLRTHRVLFDDKMLFASLLKAEGFRVPEVLAHFGRPHLPSVRHLADEHELTEFLRTVDLPVFGKPTHSSRNIGAFSMLDRQDDLVTMGDGRTTLINVLARQIAGDFQSGYMIQRFITPHKLLAQFSARALATLRVVTVIEDTKARVLYAILRLPGEATNVDDFASKGAAYALLHTNDGSVDVARSGNYLRGRAVDAHPASGTDLKGFAVPMWDRVCADTTAAHGLFPDHGVIGWDVAITPKGPLLVEANVNPQHVLYQLSSDRPLMDGAIWHTVSSVIAAQKARLKKKS